jgi:hypothetical protein
MKKMTCKQLGGGCDKAFQAGDKYHLSPMKEMQELMKSPGQCGNGSKTKEKNLMICLYKCT